MFEPRDTGSFEDEAVESFEEAGMHSGTLATTHIVKANYEVGWSPCVDACCIACAEGGQPCCS